MGQGDVGQLGLGEEVLEVRFPRVVPGIQQHHVTQVSCGGMHTAALTNTGKVRGHDSYEGQGQRL